MEVLSTWRFIARHPLTTSRRSEALWRWARWQLGSRLLGAAVAVPFVNDSRLLVRRGMTGATGSVYCGLHEFEEMAFLLHLLRPGDLFVDVGANVGAYTVLAAAAGAAVITFEPIPQTFDALLDNVNLNRFQKLVDARNVGVSNHDGYLRFTADRDAANRIVGEQEAYTGEILEVPVVTLDSALGASIPTLVKIDVEGYENDVVAGGERILANPRVAAAIVEINRPQSDDALATIQVHRRMTKLGFGLCAYDPFGRRVKEIADLRPDSNNAIYVRDIARIDAIVKCAQKFRILGTML